MTRKPMAEGQTVDSVLVRNRAMEDAIKEFSDANPALIKKEKGMML